MWETLLAVECGSEVKVVTAGGERGSVWDAAGGELAGLAHE